MSQEYSICEIAQNNGRDGNPVWIIVKEGVYDVTKFLADHPGGEASILEYAGRDATKAFNEIGHSTDAVKEMKSYKIGIVRPETTQILKSQPTSTTVDLNMKQPPESYSQPKKKPLKFFFCF